MTTARLARTCLGSVLGLLALALATTTAAAEDGEEGPRECYDTNYTFDQPITPTGVYPWMAEDPYYVEVYVIVSAGGTHFTTYVTSEPEQCLPE